MAVPSYSRGQFMLTITIAIVGVTSAAQPPTVSDAFELLIAPLSPETFFKSFFETQHIVFPRNEAKLQQLASIDLLSLEKYGEIFRRLFGII